MRPEPSEHLDPRVKNVWRINDAIWIVACAVFAFGAETIIAIVEVGEIDMSLAFMVTGIVIALLAVLCLIVLPPIRYARWRYEISDEFLDIQKGIVWRTRTVIPFIRVQNTDTKQGPILRMFGLKNVTVSTAAEEHEIVGLDDVVADQLRDRAAELARIAREDV